MSEAVPDGFEGAPLLAEREAANGELVHWMEAKPLRVGPAGVSMAAVGGFALGVGVTLAVLALSDWLSSERVVEAPAQRRT